MTRLLARPTAFLAVLALLISACGGSGADPSSRLSEAVEATFDESFAYEFRINADRAALDAVGDQAGGIAAFLSGFAVRGVMDGDSASFNLAVLGANVLQVRDVGEEAFYVRLGLEDLFGASGPPGMDPRADIAPALEALGIDEEVRAAILAALEGSWVGVEGSFDADQLADVFGGEQMPDQDEAEDDVRARFGEDLPAFVERFVTVEELVEEDREARFDVSLDLRKLMRAAGELSGDLGNEGAVQDLEADLAELPASVPGSMTAVDGLITSIVFDVADATRAEGDEFEGQFELRLDLSDHGAVDPVEAPDGASTITGDQFTEALRRLAGFATGFGTPSG